MRKILKNIASRIYLLALQYQREMIYQRFNFSKTVKFYNVSFSGNISIGEYTYINEGSRIDSGEKSRVTIGRHCAIGRYVHITAKSHDLSQPTSDEKNPCPKETENDTKIGDEVWVGDFVLIKDGVAIGDNAVIGAHSVVNRDVEPFEIVGGVPIRHIRFNSKHYKYNV